VHSDHWFHAVFRALPDLVRQLIPTLECTGAAAYSFRPIVLKKLAHSPDGVLWPDQHPGGSPELPVVLLEVQMHSDPRFLRRLGAEAFHLLQQQDQIDHLQVLVLLANRRLNLGTRGPRLLRSFLDQEVTWVDLEALAHRPELEPSMALLTLPVQREPDLGPCTRRILAARPDLIELILPILSERFQGLSPPQIMATLGISKDFWRHTRAFQYILEEGRKEGREDGRRETRSLALRQLERRCGPIGTDTRGRLETLNLEQIEALALDLLDFQGAADLHAWLERNGRPG
jgi:predicted transposase YdaD